MTDLSAAWRRPAHLLALTAAAAAAARYDVSEQSSRDTDNLIDLTDRLNGSRGSQPATVTLLIRWPSPYSATTHCMRPSVCPSVRHTVRLSWTHVFFSVTRENDIEVSTHTQHGRRLHSGNRGKYQNWYRKLTSGYNSAILINLWDVGLR